MQRDFNLFITQFSITPNHGLNCNPSATHLGPSRAAIWVAVKEIGLNAIRPNASNCPFCPKSKSSESSCSQLDTTFNRNCHKIDTSTYKFYQILIRFSHGLSFLHLTETSSPFFMFSKASRSPELSKAFWNRSESTVPYCPLYTADMSLVSNFAQRSERAGGQSVLHLSQHGLDTR